MLCNEELMLNYRLTCFFFVVPLISWELEEKFHSGMKKVQLQEEILSLHTRKQSISFSLNQKSYNRFKRKKRDLSMMLENS